MAKPIRKIDRGKIWGLIEVSRGKREASVWIRGGKVLNVYTGEVEQADVVVYEDRIAYVGQKTPKVNQETLIVDASAYTLVPGYIEPHAHPFQLYNIKTIGEFALSLGTTTLVNDNLVYFLNTDKQEQLEYLLDYSKSIPIKNFWWARLDPRSNQPEMKSMFTDERVRNMLQHELVLQSGELTSWPELLAGNTMMLDGIVETRNSGKRIEGHNPGASVETLNSMAALGVTACHEAISGEEVMRRLRLGMYATLRHSSIRPDLPVLIKELRELNFDLQSSNRLMMTTDGSMPPFHKQGFVDYLIQLALDHGVNPVSAYRMATLNPAVYYGLDQEIGGIAPGRIADILFLDDLSHPRPIKVMVNGEFAAENGRLLTQFPDFDWGKVGLRSPQADFRVGKEWFDIQSDGSPIPVLEMTNAVITRLSEERFTEKDGAVVLDGKDGCCFVSLIDQKGKWVANGILKGFAQQLDAIATTYTASQDVLVIGQDPVQMAQAVNELLSQGGGTILKEGGHTLFSLELPLGGKMSNLPMEQLIEKTTELVNLLEARGHNYIDPYYTMFFLSATHLPAVRLSAEGIISIKDQRTLLPAKILV